MDVPNKIVSSPSHINGLDSIRFVCALWVLFMHQGGFPLVIGANLDTLAGEVVKGLYGIVYNGQAAVIMFFIVSGFCIHYPYRSSNRVPLLVFYARRYIRIGVPVVIATLLALWLGAKDLIIRLTSLVITPHSIHMVEDSDVSIMWSLVCELIYYSLYPLLFVAIRKWGWKLTLGLAYSLAFGVVLIRPDAHSYTAYGNLLTWVVGLPCWLLGCRLAESLKIKDQKSINSRQIWFWRLGILIVSSLALFLRFHTPIGYPWTLTLFAIVGVFWLRSELIFYSTNNPLPFFEWGGNWSYSIYLGHMLALPFLSKVGLSFDFSSVGPILNWFGRTLIILIFCWLFYAIIEFPAHRIARLAGRKLAKTSIMT